MNVTIFAASASLVTLACLGSGQALAAPAPSFLCSRASTWVEKTICADNELAGLDLELASVFARVLRTPDPVQRQDLLREQHAWWATRDRCRQEAVPEECLSRVYRSRMQALRQRGDYPGDREISAPIVVQDSAIKSAGIGWTRNLSEYIRAIDRCRVQGPEPIVQVLSAWTEPGQGGVAIWMRRRDGSSVLCHAERTGSAILAMREKSPDEALPDSAVVLELRPVPPEAGCKPVQVIDQNQKAIGWIVTNHCVAGGQ